MRRLVLSVFPTQNDLAQMIEESLDLKSAFGVADLRQLPMTSKPPSLNRIVPARQSARIPYLSKSEEIGTEAKLDEIEGQK